MTDGKATVRLRDATNNLQNATDDQLSNVRVLMDSWVNPSDDGYQLARDSLNTIINPKEPTPLNPGDWALFLASTNLSTTVLPDYATLDTNHVKEINKLIDNIMAYVEDLSLKRPLNILMLASPGAGKSHFINCVAKKLKHLNVSPVIFNMTALQNNEDLIPAVDSARNIKIEDHLPLVFLDEFDSNQDNVALLLPLLWDGALNLGQHDLKLGRSVIVLAGSNPALPEIMESAKSMKEKLTVPPKISQKIVDLLSRINGGVIEIPTFFDHKADIDRRMDKACVAVLLLKRRFGPSLRSVPLALLRFIVNTEFRYGVRSIDHLIDQIPMQKSLRHLVLEALELPLENEGALGDSSLIYHFINDKWQISGVLKAWQNASRSKAQVPVSIGVSQEAWSLASVKDKSVAQLFVDRVEGEMDIEVAR